MNVNVQSTSKQQQMNVNVQSTSIQQQMNVNVQSTSITTTNECQRAINFHNNNK